MPKRLPKYRLHKPSGQAVVTLSGRDFYLGPHGSDVSHAEYQRLLGEWIALGRCSPPGTLPDLTVNDLILAYWSHCEGHYRKNGRPTSSLHKIKAALGPVRDLYGPGPAAEFGPLALKACRQRMVDDGSARSTVNEYTARVRQMFQWGAENELVPASVWQALQSVTGLRKGRTEAVEPEPVRPVADAAVDAVRPFVSRQVWALIELQRLTAMRSGEAVLMRGYDLNTSGPVWIYTPAEHKGEHHERGREVYLGPQAQAVVRPFLKAELSAYLFSPRDAEAERTGRGERRKGGRQPGERYDRDSYRRAIARAFGMPEKLRKIPRKLPDAERDRRRELAIKWRAKHCWHPHQLRHNAATRARKQAGLEAAQVICGHAQADVTQVYAERDRQQAVAYMLKHG